MRVDLIENLPVNARDEAYIQSAYYWVSWYCFNFLPAYAAEVTPGDVPDVSRLPRIVNQRTWRRVGEVWARWAYRNYENRRIGEVWARWADRNYENRRMPQSSLDLFGDLRKHFVTGLLHYSGPNILTYEAGTALTPEAELKFRSPAEFFHRVLLAVRTDVDDFREIAQKAGLKQALSSKHWFSARPNAKHSRKGRRPRPDAQRVQREVQSEILDEELHHARMDTLVNALYESEIASHGTGVLAGSRRFLSSLLDDLTTYDWSSVSEVEFNSILRVLCHDDEPARSVIREWLFHAPKPMAVYTKLLEQQRTLPQKSRRLLNEVAGTLGKRMEPIPEKLRDLFAKPHLIAQLEEDLGWEAAGRLAWYIAFKDKAAPYSARVYDTQFLSYPEYLKLRKHDGETPDIWSVRCLRLFGTFDRVLQYDRAWGADPDLSSLSGRLHYAGGSVLSLPTSTNWNRKAWADFALKYGPEVMRVIRVADVIERDSGVPRSLAALRKALLNSVEGALLYYGIDAEEDFASNEIREFMTRAAEVKKVITAEPLATHVAPSSSGKRASTYTLSVLPGTSPIGLFLGRIVDCCQYVGGAGEVAAVAGVVEPDAGFVTITDAADVIVAQSMFWISRSEPKILVFDSLEALGGYKATAPLNNILLPLYVKAAVYLKNKYKFSAVTLGIDSFAGVPESMLRELLAQVGVDISTVLFKNPPRSPFGYTDAGTQLRLDAPRMQAAYHRGTAP